MDSILLCTNNVIPKKLFEAVVRNAIGNLDGNCDNIVIVSQYPVFSRYISIDIPNARHPDESKHSKLSSIILKTPFLDHLNPSGSDIIVNIVVGEKAYAVETIYYQLLAGLPYCGDCISIFEHDVLYPHDYLFKSLGAIKQGVDICLWDDNVYLSYNGYFKVPYSYMFSRFCFSKAFLEYHVRDKMKRGKSFIEPALKGVFGQSGEPQYENFLIVNGDDVMDIKHGFNTGGYVLVDSYYDNHIYWGSKDLYLGLIDQEYMRATQSNLDCFYGFGEE